jgi:hypothetical protein
MKNRSGNGDRIYRINRMSWKRKSSGYQNGTSE